MEDWTKQYNHFVLCQKELALNLSSHLDLLQFEDDLGYGGSEARQLHNLICQQRFGIMVIFSRYSDGLTANGGNIRSFFACVGHDVQPLLVLEREREMLNSQR